MKDNRFLKLALFLIIFRILSAVVFVQFPSLLWTVYELSYRFSEKFYIFSKLSGHLTVEPIEYDFGTVKKGDLVHGAFKLYNSGYAPLKILKIAAGCGCTATEIMKNVINPGEYVELKFVIDTKDWEDFVNTGIELQTTDVKNPGVILKIIGFVGKGVKLTPPGGYVGVLSPGQMVGGKLYLLHGGYENFKILSVESAKGILVVDEVRTLNPYKTEISIHVVTEAPKVKKNYEDTLLIKTNVKEYSLIKSSYSWSVDPNKSLSQ